MAKLLDYLTEQYDIYRLLKMMPDGSVTSWAGNVNSWLASFYGGHYKFNFWWTTHTVEPRCVCINMIPVAVKTGRKTDVDRFIAGRLPLARATTHPDIETEKSAGVRRLYGVPRDVADTAGGIASAILINPILKRHILPDED